MPEHFTKSTVEAKFWCRPCGKSTMHYVFDGRRGGCEDCIKRRTEEGKTSPPKPAAEQQQLF